MRRIQICLEEELDEALQSESARSGKSRAALIRECVRERFRPARGRIEDPLNALVGSVDAEPVDDIDEVIYGR